MIAQHDFHPIDRLENGGFLGRNVLARSEQSQRPEILKSQGLDDNEDGAGGERSALGVSASNSDRGSRRSRTKRSAKRGPKPSKPFSWDQVKEIDGSAYKLRKASWPLNMMMTVATDPALSPAQNKRAIQCKVGHLGESLNRIDAGPHIGLTVYETTGGLHGHHLFHVPKGKRAAIIGRHHRDDGSVHLRPADEKAIGYVTKERRSLPPEFEQEMRKRGFVYRKGGEVPGKRASWTGPAQAILAGAGPARGHAPTKAVTDFSAVTTRAPDPGMVQRTIEAIARKAAPPSTIEMVAKPEQLRLFDELPEARDPEPPAIAKSLRADKGQSQAEFYSLPTIRLKQPSASNFERGHDPIAKPKVRALKYLMTMGRLAA